MRKLIRDRNLHDIAAAIRTKNGSNSTYKPSEMSDAIRALPSPGTMISKTITQNGSYNPASENADGYSSVTVNVGRNLMQKSITRNGSFSAASDNVDGYSSVSVNVPNSYNPLDEGKVVSGGALMPQTSLSVTQNGTFNTTSNNQVTVDVSDDYTLVSKTITANGTYLPANDNADGFSSVSVAVPGGFDANDEGKVVQNGALMPQTSLEVSANGTYDTTAKNSVVVSVSGGSGTILSGTNEPAAAQGSNGNLYLRFFSPSAEIPSGYVGLEYAQSNGHQTIDTGVPLTNTSYYELKAQFLASDDNNSLYGAGWSNQESCIAVWQNQILNMVGNGTSNTPYNTNAHVFRANQSTVSTDGTATAVPNWNIVPSVNIRLFATSYNGSMASRISYGRIYYCKIYNGATLIRDFVPVQRSSDGTVGMYDLVNDVFYSSELDSLVAGPTDGTIYSAYAKVNGAWQDLAGTNIASIS